MANAASQSDDPKRPRTILRGMEGAAPRRKRGPAPVHLWNPPFCGDIDMRIAGDGTWFYKARRSGGAARSTFRLHSAPDEDRYVLVTPVERVGIKVDDAPFLAVEMIVDRGGRRAKCWLSPPMSRISSPSTGPSIAVRAWRLGDG